MSGAAARAGHGGEPPAGHGGGTPAGHGGADARAEAAPLAMWLFLATEVLFFGGLLVGFAVYRGQYAASFAEASRQLDLALGTLNTAVLLTSSLTMALAVAAVRAGRRTAACTMLTATAVLGASFLLVKGIEYRHEAEAGLAPVLGRAFAAGEGGGLRGELFFNFYFAMTGLHAVHLLIGLGAVLALLWRVEAGAGSERAYTEVTGLYWHFVDVVWVFLFPILYLIDR